MSSDAAPLILPIRMALLLQLLLITSGHACSAISNIPNTPSSISNAAVMIDMVQNNPGDPVGWCEKAKNSCTSLAASVRSRCLP